jgi:Mg-chelatase subunit ChlD
LVILVDMSGSMVGPKIAMARQAYDALLAQLHPGRDEVALFTFDSSLHDRRDFTRDLASLRDALSEFEPFGTTSLYDATAATARQLAARSGTHKAIIVLTDGIDTSSEMTSRDVSGLASSIDAGIRRRHRAVVDERHMLEAADRFPDSADLRDLAEWTGGQLVFATTLVETAASTAVSSTDCARHTSSPRGERPRVAAARRQGQASVDGCQSACRILRRVVSERSLPGPFSG